MKRHQIPVIQIGFTLVEVLVALSVMSVLLAIASGSFSALIATVRQRVLGSDFLGDLHLTRSEAIRRGERVVMCVATSSERCTTAGGWQQGWMMFVDSDNSSTRETNEQVLRYHPSAPSGWVISGNRPVAHYVSYDYLGGTRLTGGAFQAGTITICRRGSGSTTAKQVIVNSVGRPRSQMIAVERCD